MPGGRPYTGFQAHDVADSPWRDRLPAQSRHTESHRLKHPQVKPGDQLIHAIRVPQVRQHQAAVEVPPRPTAVPHLGHSSLNVANTALKRAL